MFLCPFFPFYYSPALPPNAHLSSPTPPNAPLSPIPLLPLILPWHLPLPLILRCPPFPLFFIDPRCNWKFNFFLLWVSNVYPSLGTANEKDSSMWLGVSFELTVSPKRYWLCHLKLSEVSGVGKGGGVNEPFPLSSLNILASSVLSSSFSFVIMSFKL